MMISILCGDVHKFFQRELLLSTHARSQGRWRVCEKNILCGEQITTCGVSCTTSSFHFEFVSRTPSFTTVSPPGNREPEPDLSYQLIAQFVTQRAFELSIDRTKIPLGDGRELGKSKEFQSEFQQNCREKEGSIEAALAENIFRMR